MGADHCRQWGCVRTCASDRITDFLFGYSQSDYDAGYLIGLDDTGKPALKQPEGTCLLQICHARGEPNDAGGHLSPTAAARNYVTAIDNLGEVDGLTNTCRNDACRKRHVRQGAFGRRETFPPTEGVKHPYYLLGTATGFEEPNYTHPSASLRVIGRWTLSC